MTDEHYVTTTQIVHNVCKGKFYYKTYMFLEKVVDSTKHHLLYTCTKLEISKPAFIIYYS